MQTGRHACAGSSCNANAGPSSLALSSEFTPSWHLPAGGHSGEHCCSCSLLPLSLLPCWFLSYRAVLALPGCVAAMPCSAAHIASCLPLPTSSCMQRAEQ